MTIRTETHDLPSHGDFYAMNITERVRNTVTRSGIREGHALVYYQHTSGTVLIVEHEAGILVDLQDVLDAIIPPDRDYSHHRRGYDFNGASHLRTALLGVSVTVPVVDGDLLMGTYQEIIVIDFDTADDIRTRRITIQVSGE